MKKKCFVLMTLCFLSFQFLQAQVELKMSPIALLAGAGAVSIEYGVSDDFATELDIWFAGYGGALFVSGKYYLNPRKGLDRFYIGVLLGGISESGAGAGFLLGSKIVSRKNIIFDFGAGFGRSFSGGVFPYGKLHIGYRFKGGGK